MMEFGMLRVTLEIVILPPFWMTWWFKVLVFVLGIGIILLVYWLRVRTIQNQNERLEKGCRKNDTITKGHR
jgi:hypothetical protein